MSELERLSASERETEDPLISPAPAHDQTVPPPMAGGARAQRGLPKHKSPRRAQLEGNSEPPSISLSDYEKMVYGTEDVSHRRAVAFSSDLRIKSHELFKELDEISALDEKIKLKERDHDRLFKESLVLVENVETINKQIKKRLQSTKNLNHNKGMIQPGDQICTEYENRSKQDGELSHPPENIESKEDIKLKAFIHRRRKRITGIIEKAKDKLRRYDKITDEIKHLKIKQSELKSKSQKINKDLERIASMIVKLNSHQKSFRKGKPLTPLDELAKLASSWEDIKDKTSETIGPSIADATECMVKGDFCEKTSASAEFGKLVGSLLPPADVRDIVANTIGILETKPGATLGLVASFVGLFPGVGDAAKTAMKRYGDDAIEAGLRTVDDAAETVMHGAGNAAENATGTLRKQSDSATNIGANKIDDVADAGKSTKSNKPTKNKKPKQKKEEKKTDPKAQKVLTTKHNALKSIYSNSLFSENEIAKKFNGKEQGFSLKFFPYSPSSSNNSKARYWSVSATKGSAHAKKQFGWIALSLDKKKAFYSLTKEQRSKHDNLTGLIQKHLDKTKEKLIENHGINGMLKYAFEKKDWADTLGVKLLNRIQVTVSGNKDTVFDPKTNEMNFDVRISPNSLVKRIKLKLTPKKKMVFGKIPASSYTQVGLNKIARALKVMRKTEEAKTLYEIISEKGTNIVEMWTKKTANGWVKGGSNTIFINEKSFNDHSDNSLMALITHEATHILQRDYSRKKSLLQAQYDNKVDLPSQIVFEREFYAHKHQVIAFYNASGQGNGISIQSRTLANRRESSNKHDPVNGISELMTKFVEEAGGGKRRFTENIELRYRQLGKITGIIQPFPINSRHYNSAMNIQNIENNKNVVGNYKKSLGNSYAEKNK